MRVIAVPNPVTATLELSAASLVVASMQAVTLDKALARLVGLSG